MYIVNKSLSAKPGLNRFQWDLRHAGPWLKDVRRRYQNGPIAAPGTYTVNLTLNNTVLEQTFELISDPRVLESGVTQSHIEEQINLQKKISAFISEVQRYQTSLEEEAKSLKAANNTTDRLKKVEAAISHLKTGDGAYPQPMLNDQILYLYNMIGDADQIPGKEAELRLEELSGMFEKIKMELK